MRPRFCEIEFDSLSTREPEIDSGNPTTGFAQVRKNDRRPHSAASAAITFDCKRLSQLFARSHSTPLAVACSKNESGCRAGVYGPITELPVIIRSVQPKA